jgi:hypothetical protein
MGNMMSHQGRSGGSAYYQLDDGEIVPEPYDPNMPHLRGGDVSHKLDGGIGTSGWWTEPYATGKQTGYGRLPPQPVIETPRNDCREVPAEDFYAATRGARKSRRQRNETGVRGAPTGSDFDFNDEQQPNPWRVSSPQRLPELENEPQREPELVTEIEVIFHSSFRAFVKHSRSVDSLTVVTMTFAHT